jgi:hypothetical protein
MNRIPGRRVYPSANRCVRLSVSVRAKAKTSNATILRSGPVHVYSPFEPENGEGSPSIPRGVAWQTDGLIFSSSSGLAFCLDKSSTEAEGTKTHPIVCHAQFPARPCCVTIRPAKRRGKNKPAVFYILEPRPTKFSRTRTTTSTRTMTETIRAALS